MKYIFVLGFKYCVCILGFFIDFLFIGKLNFFVLIIVVFKLIVGNNKLIINGKESSK